MNMVPKKWDDLTVLVEEALLTRAKQLITLYGVGTVSPVARALEEEFHYPPCSDDVTRAMVIAERELHEERMNEGMNQGPLLCKGSGQPWGFGTGIPICPVCHLGPKAIEKAIGETLPAWRSFKPPTAALPDHPIRVYRTGTLPSGSTPQKRIFQGEICRNCGEPSHGPAWVRCPLAESDR